MPPTYWWRQMWGVLYVLCFCLFAFMCMGVFPVCVYLYYMSTWCPCKLEEGIRPLELELHRQLLSTMSGLETKPGSSARTDNILNHGAISLALVWYVLLETVSFSVKGKVRTCTYLNMCMCACMWAWMCAYEHVCSMHVCVCMCIYTQVHACIEYAVFPLLATKHPRKWKAEQHVSGAQPCYLQRLQETLSAFAFSDSQVLPWNLIYWTI